MGDGSSKTEVPEQNSKRGGSVNTKKESRRTCLTGSGTCPLSVRGLSVRPKADWGWVLNKGVPKPASHGLLGDSNGADETLRRRHSRAVHFTREGSGATAAISTHRSLEPYGRDGSVLCKDAEDCFIDFDCRKLTGDERIETGSIDYRHRCSAGHGLISLADPR